MKTGLESLDTGAPEITYSGNQGPKSPQEDQQKIAEFQLQEYMEEFERVFPDMKDQRGTPDYMKELQDYFEGLASKQSEGIGDMAMKPGLIDEYRNYKMGQEEAGEPFMSPRDYYRSLEQDRMDVKDGGVMQLVKENKDGSRPGYRGDDAARSSEGTSAGRSDPGAGAGYGDGPASGNTGSKGDDAKLEYLTGGYQDIDLDKEQKENFKNFQKQVGYSISPSSKPSNRIIGGILSAVTGIPGLGYLTGKAMDSTAMGYGTTTKNDDDDDDYTGGGNDYIPTPTVNLASIAEPITTDLEDENTFELRPDDFVSRYSIPDQFRLADGGRIGYAGGGITDLRQGYFLGKLVKKATRGIKKLVKSPIGKLALAYAGGTYLGGLKGLSGAKTSMGFLESLKTPSNLRNLVNIKNLIPGLGGGGGGSEESNLLKKAYDKAIKDGNFSEASDIKTLMTGSSKKPGLGTMAAILAPAIAGGLYTKKTEKNQPTLDEAMAQTSRGSSPFDKYNGVQGFREMIGQGNLDRSMFPFLQPTSYAADGGRIGLKEGGIGNLRGALSKEMFGYDDEDEDIIKLALGGSAGLPPVTMVSEGIDSMSFPDDESTGMAQATPTATLPNQMPRQKPMMDPRMMQQMMMASKMNPQMGNRMMAAMGGRMGFADGGANYSFGFKPGKEFQLNVNSMGKGTIKEIINSGELTSEDLKAAMDALRNRKAEGGDEEELLDMGGMEKDYRNDGGFVPMGEYERKDDVPARLSKNEFVFTADAVRNAGGGDIDKGAKIMENMMENLENGGKVSKDSQGLSGARKMFATQQRLGEVL